jgi:PHD/YefM family antitoxin component YafN of YafNO toxin-antitoxin module
VPNIPRALTCKVRKRMEAVKEQIKNGQRYTLHLKRGEEHLWILSSSDYEGSKEDLLELWKELEAMKRPDENVASWERYTILRSSFYLIKQSNCHAGYLSCTCPEGIKDEVCKHALLVMEKDQMIEPLPQPIEGRQKAGRKRKIGPALSVV